MISLICWCGFQYSGIKRRAARGKVITASSRFCKAGLQARPIQLFWLFACRGCWRPPNQPRIIMSHLFRVRLLLHYLHPFGCSSQIIGRCLDVRTVESVRG